ncbi:protein meaA [Roseospirillum parvum]|uniref:(2R)-ethylmalonyl-CoA mutase n=1 Tax=Roseospirillum parvum TaxID=83401 RepID=A0A1G7TI91_9PROT|nr:protein meaA [Roseospirillum parvum]SDG35046.1 (2R)-ethylmalonyl-CoA mutase [Roseospirillum parvum]
MSPQTPPADSAAPQREPSPQVAPEREPPSQVAPQRDRPWLFRTYSGHSSAVETNRLFRTNLARGQTGLSVAFDLPTQTGYDSDHVLARGEVGKVGVPVSHIGDMEALFEGIPLGEMNTSMTINAPAAWMLALYVAVAERQGAPRKALAGTTQNDIIKEYLSRGTHIFPPAPSMRLIEDVVSFTYKEMPRWNPMNVCSYHLQEAGATPEQELAFALATAIAVLDQVRDGGQVPPEDFPKVVGRISFFVNAGIRFLTELCKMRAFTQLWDEICQERYGIDDAKLRRFRYGVQVNSLGLTEQQPENNVYRILLEMLAVTLSRDARARAVQLPAWNEALGLPRPWDQQWSLRLQQIVAYETDLLEFGDIFEGSHVITERVEALKAEARAELTRIEGMGGAVAAVESGYLKSQLVRANARRVAAIESGEQVVVGVNRFTEAAPSPLTAGDGSFLKPDPGAEQAQVAALERWRAERDGAQVEATLKALAEAAESGTNLMEPSIACAHAGVTTGEWADTLRRVWGEYRAPTGVGGTIRGPDPSALAEVRGQLQAVTGRLGHRPRMLVGKPGLDGHSNGAEQIAVRARDVGFEVVYQGIRLTPAQIVAAAVEEGVDVVGLSVLSGSHVALVSDVVARLAEAGLAGLPVVAGGIIPEPDAALLKQKGVAAVYTPKDFDLTRIMGDILTLIDPGAVAA